MSVLDITFHPVVSVWWIITGATVILATALLLEYRRDSRWRTARLTAVVAMVMSLLGLVLRPTYTQPVSQHILLVTPHTPMKIIDSLRRLEPNLQVYGAPGTTYSGISALSSWDDLLQLDGQLRYVTGEGLPEAVIQTLPSPNYTYIAGTLPQGVTQVHLPAARVHQAATVTGTYWVRTGKHEMILEGPGGHEDSISCTTPGYHAFALHFTPRDTGRYVYQLLIKDAQGTVTREPLPITIAAEKQLHVLIAVTFPTFEVQQLKNYLADRGHQVTVRYQLSKDIYRYEYANGPARTVPRLTTDMLDNQDLLLTDASVLQNLTATESQALTDAVNRGLGLMMLFAESPERLPVVNRFFPSMFRAAAVDSTTLMLSHKATTFPCWPVQVTLGDAIPIWTSSTASLVSALRHQGLGKVSFSLIQNSYTLMLQGDSLRYAAYWNPLLEQTMRVPLRAADIMPDPHTLPRVHQPIRIEVMTNNREPVLYYDSIRIPLREDSRISGRWQGTLYEDVPGWHHLQCEGTSRPLYIFAKTNWTVPEVYSSFRSNVKYNRLPSQDDMVIQTHDALIPPLIFYIAFLLTAGFLWLAPKL